MDRNEKIISEPKDKLQRRSCITSNILVIPINVHFVVKLFPILFLEQEIFSTFRSTVPNFILEIQRVDSKLKDPPIKTISVQWTATTRRQISTRRLYTFHFSYARCAAIISTEGEEIFLPTVPTFFSADTLVRSRISRILVTMIYLLFRLTAPQRVYDGIP